MKPDKKLLELLKTHEGRLKYWTDAAKKLMLGKKIVDVHYAEYGGTFGLVIVLEDGTNLYPMNDDEGNYVGAVHTNQDVSVLPVIRKR
jgi:hypothetical protein